MFTLRLAMLGLLSVGCAWDARQQGEVVIGLPCDMSDAHIQAWQTAAQEWRSAFPHAIEVVACAPELASQVRLGADTLDADLTCNGKSCEWMATVQLGKNRANGCDIDVQVKVEASGRSALQWYRNVAVHEMGHCLGLLEHSVDEHAVMYYAPKVDAPLHVELSALQRLYK